MSSGQIKFIIDECTGPIVANWLGKEGFQVLSIYDQMRGIKNFEIISIAQNEHWVIITNDKDFGDMVFREKLRHRGIILLRLDDERSKNKIEVLRKLIQYHIDDLLENFVVVTEKTVRVIKTS